MICFESSSPPTWGGSLWCVRDILDQGCLLGLGPEQLSQCCCLYPKEEAGEAHLGKKSYKNWLQVSPVNTQEGLCKTGLGNRSLLRGSFCWGLPGGRICHLTTDNRTPQRQGI